MRKEKSINYNPVWDENGTVYRQTINIKKETLKTLIDALQKEVFKKKYHGDCVSGDNYYRWLYLKETFGEILNGYVFMNLTQRDFFNKHLNLNIKDRNTCFYII